MNFALSKVFSGRWILTVACAYVFIYAALTGILSGEGLTAIIVSVFKDYFNRVDRNPSPS